MESTPLSKMAQKGPRGLTIFIQIPQGILRRTPELFWQKPLLKKNMGPQKWPMLRKSADVGNFLIYKPTKNWPEGPPFELLIHFFAFPNVL